jgi:hypothetical protein
MVANVKFPSSVQRRDFNLKNFSNWKATEYKNFFFYIAIPILNEFLSTNYIFNIYCLVLGIIFKIFYYVKLFSLKIFFKNSY